MTDLTLVKSIRHVRGGYIVEARWPIGNDPSGYGEVVCTTLDEVIEVVEQCDPEPIRSATRNQTEKEKTEAQP